MTLTFSIDTNSPTDTALARLVLLTISPDSTIAPVTIAPVTETPSEPIAPLDVPTVPDAPIAPPIAPKPLRALGARKPKAVKGEQPIVDTANLKRDELYKHFKSTAPCEDLRFFLDATHDTISQAQIDEATVLVGLFDANGKLTIPRPEYYKRLIRLQDHWRQDAGERWTRERAIDRQNAATADSWMWARRFDAQAFAEAA